MHACKYRGAAAHRLAIFWETDSAPARFWFSMLSLLTYTFWYPWDAQTRITISYMPDQQRYLA